MKIMIVDDEEMNLELFADLFEDEDVVEEVRCYTNGVDALENIRVFAPNVIILDVMMPKINGFEVSKEVRSMTGILQPRIVMVTGMSGEDIESKRIESGADALFLKPVNVNVLLNNVLGK